MNGHAVAPNGSLNGTYPIHEHQNGTATTQSNGYSEDLTSSLPSETGFAPIPEVIRAVGTTIPPVSLKLISHPTNPSSF